MRHKKKINHLGRQTQHRNAMLSNMATSLILEKRIFTTLAKAKALRGFVEPLITKSKEDSTHSRRTVFAYLQNKQAVSELFREVSQKVADRPGGYTRILKTGFRKGDAAEMCFIELVDYNLNMLKTTDDAAKKTRRSRRGKKSSDAETKPAAVAAEKPVKEEVVETPVKDEVVTEEPVVEPTTEVEDKVEETKTEEKKTEEAADDSKDEEKKPE